MDSILVSLLQSSAARHKKHVYCTGPPPTTITTTTVITTNKQLEDLHDRMSDVEKEIEAEIKQTITDLQQDHNKKIQALLDANAALVKVNEAQAARLRELETAVFPTEGATTSTTTATTTTSTTREATTPFDGTSRAVCNGKGKVASSVHVWHCTRRCMLYCTRGTRVQITFQTYWATNSYDNNNCFRSYAVATVATCDDNAIKVMFMDLTCLLEPDLLSWGGGPLSSS